MISRRLAGGGNMAKRRRRVSSSHHRRRRSNPFRRRRNIGYLARSRNPIRRHHRRRRNPSLGLPAQFGEKIGGALIGGIFGARMLPQMLLKSSNSGIMGYVADAAGGGVVSWLMGKFIGPAWGEGGWIGTAVAVGSRIISDKFSSAVGGSSSLSGDLDFDLGYYLSDKFPYMPGASMGPFRRFPGDRYMTPVAVPTTSTAVQAGTAAAAALQHAAAALPAKSASMSGDRWGSNWD
jgi:hypothetical protein